MTWHRGLADPYRLHIPYEGQTISVTWDFPQGWVWAVCGNRAEPRPSELTAGAPCPWCARWAATAAKNP